MPLLLAIQICVSAHAHISIEICIRVCACVYVNVPIRLHVEGVAWTAAGGSAFIDAAQTLSFARYMNRALETYTIKNEATIRLGICDRCKFWPVKSEFMLLELLKKRCVYQSLHTVVYCSDESPASRRMQNVHCLFRSWLLCVLLSFQVAPFCKRSCTFHTHDRKQANERKFLSHAMLLNCLMLPPFFQLVVFDVQEVRVWYTMWSRSTRA